VRFVKELAGTDAVELGGLLRLVAGCQVRLTLVAALHEFQCEAFLQIGQVRPALLMRFLHPSSILHRQTSVQSRAG
jgi:hypothetical protein